ncbi:hypothetical protein POM88_003690 [Heracleum sosnowskyi]|uniref:Uncharacterized protein n=1 Tax=Heracleum sosnowskyi TaxID=360622 RepID=A0AAD8N726_9APIA|nr:hypothetical protein POM88_003690 [Heracleum sosnowskyi]
MSSRGYRSTRDRSPTPYPRGSLYISSVSDSDPSEEPTADDEPEDSSVQILTPPLPPVIDLVSSPHQIIEIPDSPVTQHEDDLLTVASAPATTVSPTVQTSETPLLITPDMCQYEIPEPVVSEQVDESQLSPVLSTVTYSTAVTAPGSSAHVRATSFMALLTTPSPIYVEAPTAPTFPELVLPPASGATVCDTTPPVPTLHVPAPVELIPPASSFLIPPVDQPAQPEGEREPVPWHVHYHLFQHYRWVWARYEEIFATRDAILRLMSVPDPVSIHGGGSLLLRDIPMEIVHQISISVLAGLQTDITALPSSSTRAVDQSTVAILISRAIAEFQRRVGEMFGQ